MCPSTSPQPAKPQSASPQPASFQPTSPRLASSQPASSQPASSQPASSDPASSQPASSQSTTSQPGSSLPISSQPASSQPASSQPGSSHLDFSQPAYPRPTACRSARCRPIAIRTGLLPPNLLINEMATKSHPNLVRLLGYCVDMSYEAERMEQIVVFGVVMLAVVTSPLSLLTACCFSSLLPVHCCLSSSPACSFGVVMLEVITARKAIRIIESNQVNFKQWAASLVAAGDVAALKDPHLQAPDDLVLRMARLALSCIAMPTASRPGMSRVLAELLLLKEELIGEEEDRMAARIDHELESIEQVDFSLELARIEGIQLGS
ncbi:unnamed protein product [Closterium sp. Naga37s-1]|nr:unnamed protein product [Closterium sp. Naga37s-1]